MLIERQRWKNISKIIHIEVKDRDSNNKLNTEIERHKEKYVKDNRDRKRETMTYICAANTNCGEG
jgi:hypothetical protein